MKKALRTSCLKLASLVAVTCGISGCASAFGPPWFAPDKNGRARFDHHAFGAQCFNVWGCRVLYANRYQQRHPDTRLASAPPQGLRVTQYISGTDGAIMNFPSPAVITWKSKDGVGHEATVDIARIFRGQEYIHNVPPEDISENAYLLAPTIILIVDDREVTVYLSSHVPVRNSIDRSPFDPRGSYQIVQVFRESY